MNKIVYFFIALSFVIGVTIGSSTNVIGQQATIPIWIKNTALFWGQGQISDSEFINALQWLINQGILHVPNNTSSSNNNQQANQPLPNPSASKTLQVIMFAPDITQAQLDMLKSNFRPNDGIITSDLSVITKIQDYTGIQGLTHYILAPRIGPIIGTCNLGPVPSVQDFANQATVLKPQYNIKAILYDDESWCWTPLAERDNFISSLDQEAQIAHQNGFESGMQPTHDLLVQYYKQVHFSNVDFLLIQFQKYMTTSSSGYTQIDPNYYGQVQDIINTAKAQNPHITIFLQFNLYWSSVDNIKKAIDYFRGQLDGVSIVNLSPNDSDVTSGVPFLDNNTPENQQAIIQYAHG